jgi:hypothetical protein
MCVPEIVKNGFKPAFACCDPLPIRLMSVVLAVLILRNKTHLNQLRNKHARRRKVTVSLFFTCWLGLIFYVGLKFGLALA